MAEFSHMPEPFHNRVWLNSKQDLQQGSHSAVNKRVACWHLHIYGQGTPQIPSGVNTLGFTSAAAPLLWTRKPTHVERHGHHFDFQFKYDVPTLCHVLLVLVFFVCVCRLSWCSGGKKGSELQWNGEGIGLFKFPRRQWKRALLTIVNFLLFLFVSVLFSHRIGGTAGFFLFLFQQLKFYNKFLYMLNYVWIPVFWLLNCRWNSLLWMWRRNNYIKEGSLNTHNSATQTLL